MDKGLFALKQLPIDKISYDLPNNLMTLLFSPKIPSLLCCVKYLGNNRNNVHVPLQDVYEFEEQSIHEDFSASDTNYTPSAHYTSSEASSSELDKNIGPIYRSELDPSVLQDSPKKLMQTNNSIQKSALERPLQFETLQPMESLNFSSDNFMLDRYLEQSSLIQPLPQSESTLLLECPSSPKEYLLLENPNQESSLLHSDCGSDISHISTSPLRNNIHIEDKFIRSLSTLPNTQKTAQSSNETDCAGGSTSDMTFKAKTRRKKAPVKDFCFFCETFVLNFCRHLLRNHGHELEVQRILSKPKHSKERKQDITKLRKKGNFIQNSVDVKKPMRKQTSTNYLPCTDCLGFYSKKLLWKHKKKCSGLQGRAIQSEAQSLLVRNLQIDEKLRKNVFPTMRADKISLVAKSDILICAFGSQYLKVHKEKHFINVTSRKMREMAKLLIEIKAIKPSITNFFDALRPENYDCIVAATKIVGKYDADKDRFESPTFAMNISTSIKQCCNIAIMHALKKQGPYMEVNTAEVEASIKTLIQIIYSTWKFDISSQAATDLNKKKWNKVTIVPLANDLKILKAYLNKKAEEASNEIRSGTFTSATYLTLLETIYCRVLLLNRRRPGELQRLTVHDYTENINPAEKYEEFDRALSLSEQVLVKRFKRIVIRGKRGRGVPVLFNTEVQADIELLLSVRNKFLSPTNKMLFGNPGFENSIYGYKVLERYAKQSGAKNPTAISSTRLRKHLATLTQIFSMSENDMEQLATFMGHTTEVHKRSYRLPDDVYQTAKISKLLLLMEDGKADAFKGKTLDQIELNLNEDIQTTEEEEPMVEIEDILDREVPEPILPSLVGEHDVNEPQPGPSTTTQIVTATEKGIKRGKKRTLVPWTDEQKSVVAAFFKNHIRKKIPPKRNECETLKSQHAELLHNKDWLKIKVYIQNIYSKK